MSSIYILERKNGHEYVDYTKQVDVGVIDRNNSVLIELYDSEGTTNIISIPTSKFPEFVRECQSMLKTLAPE